MLYYYFKGIYRLFKISFAIQDCEEIYFLQDTMKLFMRAENKTFQYGSRGNDFELYPRTIMRPRIISRLPQFSEALHYRIQELRAEQDSQLSKYRVYKKKAVMSPKQRHSLLSLDEKSFFSNNEALLLTYPGHISGLDTEVDGAADQPPEYTQ